MFSFISNIINFSNEAPLDVLEKKTRIRGESVLHALTESVASGLLESESAKARSLELQNLASSILKFKSWPNVDWRQFAHMHNASIIRNTSLEGGSIINSVRAWKDLLSLWQKGKGLFFSLDLSYEQIGQMVAALEDLEFFHSLFPPLSTGTMADWKVQSYGRSFQRALMKRLKERGTVYVPFGYRHGVTNEGHVAPCKMVWEKDGVTIHPLNLGDGSEPHALLNFTTSQEKISFRFYPIKVPHKMMWGDAGFTAICHLLRYQSDPPSPTQKHYCGSDLYDIFLTLGTLIPSLGSKPEHLEAKGQRSGTCPEKGVKNVEHDVLLECGLLPKQIKKVFLNLTLCSLIAGYHAYQLEPSEVHQMLLKNAAEEFGLALEKLKKEVSYEEYVGGIAVVQEIKKMTATPFKGLAPIKTEHLLIKKEEVEEPTSVPSHFDKMEKEDISVEPPKKNRLEVNKLPKYFEPSFEISAASKTFNEWIERAESLTDSEALYFFTQCTRTLTLPEWGKEDVWDTLPPKEVEALLIKFETFIFLGLQANRYEINSEHYSCYFIEKMLALHTLFVIADKLARKCEWTRLSGFASPFVPHLYPFEPKDFISLPIGEENKRYSQILAYFKASREEAKGAVIFPVEPVLSIEVFEKEVLHGAWSHGCHHIRFLRQHVFEKYPTASNSELLPIYMYVWKNMKTELPREVYSLYYFAFVSQTLFFGREIPQKLEFKKGEDGTGKQALLMDSRKGKFLSKHPSLEAKKGEESTLYFEEFSEMGIKRKFTSMLSRASEKLTTNDSVCARLEEQYSADGHQISEPVYRDLLRITRRDNLKLPLAIYWASTHLIYLDHPGIQKILDHCFFHPEGLYTVLKETPSYIEHIRGFIVKGLEYYRDNPHHLKVILFLIRTGICFETHFIAQFGNEKSSEMLLFYKSKLEKLLSLELKETERTEVMWHWIFVESQREKKSAKECITFLHTAFRLPFMKEPRENWSETSELSPKMNYGWLKGKLPLLVCDHVMQLREELGDVSFRNQVCHNLFAQAFPEFVSKVSEGEWEGEFPVFTCGEYYIDFAKVTLGHRKKGEFTEVNHLTAFPGWEKMKEKYGVRFWLKGGRWSGAYESTDGRINLNPSGKGGMVFDREILVEGKQRWARYHRMEHYSKEKDALSFLTDGWNKKFPYLHFVLIDREKGDPHIITYNYETDEPAFRIDFPFGGGGIITRLDKFGNTLPIRLVNLEAIQETEHPLAKTVLRYTHPNNVLCFVHAKTKEIVELNFHEIGLQFKGSEKGLECAQYPGFYLQTNATLEELNHFPSAFLLKNHLGELKVIIPSAKLTTSSEDFSTKVGIKDGYIDYHTHAYHEFRVDSIDGTLISKKATANLYLALLFKMQRDQVKALKYLRRAHSSTFFDHQVEIMLSEFTKLTDSSPSALAFNAKLLYLLVDNINLMLEGRFGERNYVGKNYPFLKWGQKAYINYLKAISREELSAIPKDLRLTLEEEREILRTLKKNGKDSFPQILTLRYKLLCAGQESVTASISPKEVLVCPPAYTRLSSLKALGQLKLSSSSPFPYGVRAILAAKKWEDTSLPTSPNRLEIAAVKGHFPDLYEQARVCKTGVVEPFDFTLLSLLKVQEFSRDNTVAHLGSLLFYVRHFPHLFNKITFKGIKPTSDLEMNAVFNQIVEVVQSLEGSKVYAEFSKQFLNETVTFEYERETVLSLPKPNETSTVELKECEKISWESRPFRSYRRKLFKRTVSRPDIPETPSFLDEKLAPKSETLEADLVSKFEVGYEELKKRKTSTYTLRPENLKKVKEALTKEKNQFHDKLVNLRKQLICRVNTPYMVQEGKLAAKPLMEEMTFRLHQETLQTQTILPETIMKEAVLRNDPGFLARHCPLLKASEIKEIMEHVCDYYHFLVLYQLCRESEELIDKLSEDPSDTQLQTDLAEKLAYEFAYDPREYPEISYFKVTEGKLPRQDQAPIYLWICEGLKLGENRLFQHKAGGGKTDYLTPLLMLRAKREGLTPIFFSTQMIYSVDRENLSYTMKKLDEDLCYLEVGLHMKLSVSDLQFIFEQLTQYHNQGRGMIMTPQTYYALRLQYLYAGIKEEDEEKVKWLSLILNFFETKCLQLGDESHRNFDPLTRAIYGVGEFVQLPKEEHALFLAMLKPLMGFETVLCDNGLPVSQVSRLEKNLLGSPSEEDIVYVQKAIAKHMSESSLLNVPEEHQKALIDYWTDKESEQPACLKKLAKVNRQAAGLIALTGYFILDLLPQVVNLRTELDHTSSIYPEEEFDTPCHHKTPSTAQYEDSYFGVVTSIKGTSHRALSNHQIEELIKKMLNKDWTEQKETKSSDTESACLFAKWVESTALKGKHLRDISLSNPKQMQEVCKALSRHPEVIDYYLGQFILPQIGYSLEQLTCTPAHLLYGFARSVLFSATPLSQMIYPRGVDAVRYDPIFETEVVTEYCKEKNQQRVFTKGPETFFADMTENKEVFNQTSVFIDPAGFFCDSRNEEVAKDWLLSSDLDGVLYFKEGRSLNVDKGEKVCLLLRSDLKHPIELEGSNIKEALAERSLDWKKLKLGTYYDASHTESANILQKKGTTAFVYLADNLTASRLIQALMRLRGLLDQKMIQNVVWVYPKDLIKKIPVGSSGELDGKGIFAWTISNEVEQMRKRIVLAGFQEISYQVEKLALDELKKHLHDPVKQLKLFKKFEKGLLEIATHDPYGSFSEHEIQEKTEDVLMAFAKKHYTQFGYAISFEENLTLQEELKAIVKNVKKRIHTIATHWERKVSVEVEQHIRLQKDMEQMHYRPRPFDPFAAEGIYGDFKVTNPVFPKGVSMESTQRLFGSPFLTENLFLEQNQITTAKNAGESLKESYLKPIDFFLIIFREGEEPVALVNINEISATIYEDLIKGTEDKEVKHKAFLVTADGKLFQKGHGRLMPSKEEVEQILTSAWMRDLVIDAALLRGQVAHEERLLERIKKWKGFPEFWTRIVKAQPNPETCNRKVISKLLTHLS